MVFPTFFNLSLNLAIRSSWSEPQSATSTQSGTSNTHFRYCTQVPIQRSNSYNCFCLPIWIWKGQDNMKLYLCLSTRHYSRDLGELTVVRIFPFAGVCHCSWDPVSTGSEWAGWRSRSHRGHLQKRKSHFPSTLCGKCLAETPFSLGYLVRAKAYIVKNSPLRPL